MNSLTEQLARAQQDAETGIALVRLNLEFHPDSHYTHFVLGGLQAASGKKDEAAASIRRALELDPGNSWYQRALQQVAEPEQEE